MSKVGGMWSCCSAERTLLGAAGLGCEQTFLQKPSTSELISGATQLAHCQRSKSPHSLPSLCSQTLLLEGAFDPKSSETLGPGAGLVCSRACRTPLAWVTLQMLYVGGQRADCRSLHVSEHGPARPHQLQGCWGHHQMLQ